MLVGRGNDPGDGADIFLDLLPEGARALAVEDAHGADVQHDGVVDVAHHLLDGLVHPHAADVQLQAEVRLPLGDAGASEEEKLTAFRTAPLKVGEKVRIKDGGMVGEVSKVSTKAVTVIVGNLSTKLPLDRVERVTSNEYRAAVRETPKPRQVYDAAITERKANFRLELDVRGMRVNEAIEQVMR